jgi:hypothetical protein
MSQESSDIHEEEILSFQLVPLSRPPLIRKILHVLDEPVRIVQTQRPILQREAENKHAVVILKDCGFYLGRRSWIVCTANASVGFFYGPCMQFADVLDFNSSTHLVSETRSLSISIQKPTD